MIQLYWSPRSRSISAIWLLEETGLPYERVLTDITTGAQKAAEYLAINPMGKVPGLKDADAALGEAAAICAYIADRYPETGLAPAATDPLRARYLQRLFFSPSSKYRRARRPGAARRRPSTRSTPRCKRGRGFSARSSRPPTSCSAQG
jgi:glutathione S-transferase